MISRRVIEISSLLHRHYFESGYRSTEMSLFLCGGASKTDAALRAALGAQLSAKKSKYTYAVHYPESIFIEAILGHKRNDLLELENLLAESVSAVVIPLQGPGTFTELGAFTNHPSLREKLVVIVDPKYKLSKSFINTGPLRHLKRSTSSCILYHELSIGKVDSMSQAVAEAARKIAIRNPIVPSLVNPLSSKDFYFSLAAVFEPLPKKVAIEIAEQLRPAEKQRVAIVAETVLNILVNERRIMLSKDDSFVVSARSLEKMYADITTEKRRKETADIIWNLRAKAINCIHRRKSVAWS